MRDEAKVQKQVWHCSESEQRGTLVAGMCISAPLQLDMLQAKAATHTALLRPVAGPAKIYCTVYLHIDHDR